MVAGGITKWALEKVHTAVDPADVCTKEALGERPTCMRIIEPQ